MISGAVRDELIARYGEPHRRYHTMTHIEDCLAQVAACAALADSEHLDRIRTVTHAGLAQLEAGLRVLGLRFAASDANFICVEVGPGADALNDRLLRSGVITRPLGGFGLTTHLRVSVGTERENERFLSTLARELRS